MDILIKYLRHYWKLLVFALLLATINQVFSLLDPYIFRLVLDNYVTKFDQFTKTEFIHGAGLLLLASMGVAFVSRVAKNFQDYYTNTITQKLGAKMYTDGLAHSLELPYQVFEDQRSGETLGILQQLRTNVQNLITALISVLFTTIIGFAFVIFYAFSVSWVIALVYISIVPILALISTFLSDKVKAIQTKIVAKTAALSGSTTESLRNIELVKSLGLADQEIGRLNNTTGEILKLELEKIKYIRSISFIQGTIINALRIGMLFVMLFLVYLRTITLGEFFSLYIYSFFLFNPLQELGTVINTYREAQASLKNFKDILATPIELKSQNPKTLGTLNEIGFKDVSFRHLSGNRDALSNMSFKAQSGETIAFVGPSGSGKTTLVKLLVGLYRPVSGQVLYNNLMGSEIELSELRKQIGLVTQDTQVFAGSIRDNLKFVNSNASDDELWAVLKQAAADSLMARASLGLDTVIGEGGVKVSGGEKQRLSIARSLLRKPSLLVFDEATSSLDSLTEEQITTTIRSLSKNKEQITVLIAHRLSTIMHADQIYVLEKGKLAESGKHTDLLEQKGLYYAMWRQQIGKAS